MQLSVSYIKKTEKKKPKTLCSTFFWHYCLRFCPLERAAGLKKQSPSRILVYFKFNPATEILPPGVDPAHIAFTF